MRLSALASELTDEASGVPVLSIVIPVRNREEKLPACLRTIQDSLVSSTRLEVVVADNTPNGLDLAEAFTSDPRIRIVRPQVPLHMTDNFEFGRRAAKGEWLLFLGSDDGVVSHRLGAYIDHLARTSSECVTGPTVGFRWPDLSDVDGGRLSWWSRPLAKPIVVDAQGQLARAHRSLSTPGRLDSSRLPMPYMHGAVRARALIDTDRRRTGQVFRTQTPDTYIMMALLHTLETYEILPWAIGIQGSSRSSNGHLALAQPEAWRAHPDRAIRPSDLAASTLNHMEFNTSIPRAYADAFYTAREATCVGAGIETQKERATWNICEEADDAAATARPSARTLEILRRLQGHSKQAGRISQALGRVARGDRYTYLASTHVSSTVSVSQVVEAVDFQRVPFMTLAGLRSGRSASTTRSRSFLWQVGWGPDLFRRGVRRRRWREGVATT